MNGVCISLVEKVKEQQSVIPSTEPNHPLNLNASTTPLLRVLLGTVGNDQNHLQVD
jgi:hypothetical protein